MPFFRKGPHGFTQKGQLSRFDSDLASTSSHGTAFNPYEVADIQKVIERKTFFAESVLPKKHLQAATRVLNVYECGTAHVTDSTDQAASHANHLPIERLEAIDDGL